MLERRGRFTDERPRPFRAEDGGWGGRPSPSPFRVAGSLVSLSGFAACLTILYHGMRGVMRLGGFVASGGPYQIAHPAPGWVWIVPVSILAGVALVGLNIFLGRSLGGLSLMVLAWPALFLSLGWNFLEFAFKPLPSGHRVVWAWLICGVMFVVMGAFPALFFFKALFRRLSGRPADMSRLGVGPFEPEHPNGPLPGFLIVQVLTLALGVYGGILLFRAVAGP